MCILTHKNSTIPWWKPFVHLKQNDSWVLAEHLKEVELKVKGIVSVCAMYYSLKWCRNKWVKFYSAFYLSCRALFEGENDFCICLRESFPQLKTRNLTRMQWCKIRRLMGKPRRSVTHSYYGLLCFYFTNLIVQTNALLYVTLWHIYIANLIDQNPSENFEKLSMGNFYLGCWH